MQEIRIAAVKWYELGDISQVSPAEIAGLTRRAEFINALLRYQVDFNAIAPVVAAWI
ncbi:MAG: UPF0175 family protein [Nostoc sp. DedQUE08]|uniref:UPF0175 family protein n=1 Tax=Nostoc sp. DedQUE08 TaxID=3075393 RepID=UPI002AD40845|nr:UPF0175 family protein [Nostoc sp. DedQUE08]MDZ8066567.1 UPF0175 family protein [Nostoc sp. DedQUE08]